LFIEKTAIEKPLAILIKRRREKIQIDKIIWDITTNTNEIQKIIKEYFGTLY
jgi:hypothetical protein